MTRVLVVWEDAHCESLGDLVKRAVNAHGAPDAVARPTVVRHTSRGNGAFSRYVHDTWPLARARGVPLDPRPIDHVICVVDADRLHELKVVAAPPSDTNATAAWHEEAERAWKGWLHSHCAPDGPPVATVHGLVLRWAKESALLAGFDQPAWARLLDVEISAPATQAELRRQCKPHPSEISDAAFTNTFRRPLSCLQIVRQACKLSRLDKNDPTIDDALKALARESLPTVLARVPDLARLASLIWSLQQ
ncbi:MAG TPA: hypothetical protein VNO30_36530 [Kofleriaceae bacterium]|nr:hypothetical protein [Kofleriaceae bacterium]